MMAARYAGGESSLEIVKALLAAGANVNAAKKNGWTPLMMAARYAGKGSSLEAVEALITAGADVNAAEKDGWTPLMMALINRHGDDYETYKLVKALLKPREGMARVDLTLRENDRERTALNFSKQLWEDDHKFSYEIFILLLDNCGHLVEKDLHYLPDAFTDKISKFYLYSNAQKMNRALYDLLEKGKNEDYIQEYSEMVIVKHHKAAVLKEITAARERLYYHPDSSFCKFWRWGKSLCVPHSTHEPLTCSEKERMTFLFDLKEDELEARARNYYLSQ
jgi:hypothetical protein